ncbi:DUF805 domain-containing protein [Pseudomonas akapageensis]|uniref:DUF805 domain-containing protein n=1 Tax=Pseudomonas akapageensis TaxID=2609961 RepID=UPI001407BE6B|nr:DUF805 domain-containing protein [Pseudomonas akapageensis]
MTEARFNIVFDGSLLPGTDLMMAKNNLAALFNRDLASIEKLFSGREVILKRNLPVADAQRYLNALHKAGVEARLEQEPGTEEHIAQPAPTGSTNAPDVSPPSPYAPPQAPVDQTSAEYGELSVLSIEGRIGRLRYLAWTLVLLLTVVAAMGVFSLLFYQSPMFSGLMMAIAVLCFLTINIQISVQRLHDLGWSGWLWLLNLVPLVSAVFTLMLLVLPGNPGPNQYGPPPPPNSVAVRILAWMWVVVFAGGIAMGWLGGVVTLFTQYTHTISL